MSSPTRLPHALEVLRDLAAQRGYQLALGGRAQGWADIRRDGRAVHGRGGDELRAGA